MTTPDTILWFKVEKTDWKNSKDFKLTVDINNSNWCNTTDLKFITHWNTEEELTRNQKDIIWTLIKNLMWILEEDNLKEKIKLNYKKK